MSKEIDNCWKFLNRLYKPHPLIIWCDASWCPETKIAAIAVAVDPNHKSILGITNLVLAQVAIPEMESNSKAEKEAVSLALKTIERLGLNKSRRVVIKSDCKTASRRNIASEGVKNVRLKWASRQANAAHKAAKSKMRYVRDR